jgi:N-acyl-D-aspartate/D-glutamate deacylase
MQAIAKMSLMPAQPLELLTPVAKRLGRLQEGARADIAVFDPATVQDHATFRAPTEPSTGMRYVLVAGTMVLEGGKVVNGVAPGQPLLRVPTSRVTDAPAKVDMPAVLQ